MTKAFKVSKQNARVKKKKLVPSRKDRGCCLWNGSTYSRCIWGSFAETGNRQLVWGRVYGGSWKSIQNTNLEVVIPTPEIRMVEEEAEEQEECHCSFSGLRFASSS